MSMSTAEILALARNLPSGIDDPRSLDKLEAEKLELIEEIESGDRVAALLEAGDCLYYAEKARHCGLIGDVKYLSTKIWLVRVSGFSIGQIERACIEKYRLRARPKNPKNDREERNAVAYLI